MSLFYFLNFTENYILIFTVLKLHTKHIKPYNYFLLLCVLLFVISCGSNKNIATSDSSIESNPKIIFLNYSIKKTANNTKSIQFLNLRIVDGKLKNTKITDEGHSGDLICTQLDKNSNELQRFIIKSPLTKNIEYINDSNSFDNKKIDLDSAQFSLRLQLKPNTKYINISDFSSSKTQENPLIITTIN